MIRNIVRYIKTFTLWDLLVGMRLTGAYFWKRKITIQYPEEKTPVSPRFRGLHALRRYPNGEERCIACKLCEEACPVDSIVLTNMADYHLEARGENIMTKEKLLAIGDQYETQIANDRNADAEYR